MGTAPTSTGLKNQWGVGDPNAPGAQAKPTAKDTGSDKQANDFQAAFQKEQGVINGHLQYTSANAEASKHGAFASRRDAQYSAFQSALAKIDRTNPSKAQGDIDKVLGDARALNSEVSTFRKEAEKARNDWESRQAKYDEAVRQVEELQAWEDPKAPALRGLVDGIRGQTNERKYAEACSTLDQLLPKLKPIYDDYVKQREAKPKYEQQLAEISAKLDPLKGADRPSQPMTAKAGEADAALQEAKGKAETKNFVAGLESLARAKTLVDELDKLTNDPQRKQYLTDSQGAEQVSTPQPDPAFKSLDGAWAAIAEAGARAQPLADAGDYVGANQALADAKTKLEEYRHQSDELVKARDEYQQKATAIEPLMQQAQAIEFKSLQARKDALTTSRMQMGDLATNEDFAGALAAAQALETEIQSLQAEADTLKQARDEYQALADAIESRMQEVNACDMASMQASKDSVVAAYQAMTGLATNEDFAGAKAAAQTLDADIQTFLAELETIKQARDAYLALAAEIEASMQQVNTCDMVNFEAQKSGLVANYQAMSDLATKEDFTAAQTAATSLKTQIQAFLTEFEAAKQARDEFQKAWAAVKAKLSEALLSSRAFAAMNADRQALTAGQAAVDAAAGSEDYVGATRLAADLDKKVDAYLTQAKTKEEAVKKKGDDITTQLDGASDATRGDVAKAAAAGLSEEEVKSLPTPVRNRLMAEMQKGGLSDDEKNACKNLFSQKYLDPKFEKLDDAKREQLIQKMKEDPDFKKARTDWNTMTEAERVAVLKKAADYQAAAFDIPVTEVEAYSPKNADGTLRRQRMGEYSHSEGKLKVSREAMQDKGFDTVLDTVVHENAHRYQATLVEKLNKVPPEIKPGDPEYDQAVTFAMNDKYYVQPKVKSTDAPTPNTGDEYFTQPQETHSRRTGEGVAAAGIGK